MGEKWNEVASPAVWTSENKKTIEINDSQERKSEDYQGGKSGKNVAVF